MIFERLDRAYCNDSWRSEFPEALIINYPIFVSDHGPIIVECQPLSKKRKRPYEIEAWCLEYEPIDKIVDNAWHSEIQGSALFRIQRKLQIIAKDCKHWCLDFKKEKGIQWDDFN